MIFPFHFRADPSPALLIAMRCLHGWEKNTSWGTDRPYPELISG
jgi:hypothetical protein